MPLPAEPLPRTREPQLGAADELCEFPRGEPGVPQLGAHEAPCLSLRDLHALNAIMSVPGADPDVAAMGLGEGLARVLDHTASALPAELASKLQAALSKESLATMEVVTAGWVLSHFVGVGEAADLVMAGLGAAALGTEGLQVIRDLTEFAVLTATARTEEDLETAGVRLARALSTAGVDLILALVTTRAASAARGTVGSEPPSSGLAPVLATEAAATTPATANATASI